MMEFPSGVLLALSGIAGLVCAVGLLILWEKRSYERKVEHNRAFISKKLNGRDFFYRLLVGKHRRHAVGKHMVWSDAPYTVIIKREEDPIALIGFECSKNSLTVVQLQGLRGVNLRGLPLGPYLLEHAEAIARALGKNTVFVPCAYRHPYYDLDEESPLYPQLYKHQARLRAIYDKAPGERGYAFFGAAARYKLLRKPITLVRAIKYHVVLFNRHARASQQLLSQYADDM